MNPDEKKLKAKELKRKNIIYGVKRINEFLQKYVEAQHKHEVPLRIGRLDNLWEIFETVQAELEELDDSEKAAIENLACRAQVEELYFATKAALLAMLPTVLSVQTPSTSTAQPQAAPANLTNVKLPTITLPEFDGDFNDWLTFHDTFVSMIHAATEISCVQKFHYLRAALKGEAANLIQSITITAGNYAVAWDTLVKRYSNKVILRKKHIRALLKYPKIQSSNVEALHKIVDEFQRHTKVLQQLGEPVEQFSSILMEILEDKLDDASLSAWEESVASDEHPTFDKMIEFLQKRSRVLETILINRPAPVPVKPSNHQPAGKKLFHPRVSSNAVTESPAKTFPLCPACEKVQHSIMDCPVFNGMDVRSRLKVVSDKKLCSNCFRSDHFARACRSKYRCKHCSRNHHSMLHPGPFEVNQSCPDNRPRPGPSSSGSFNVATATVNPSAEPVSSNAATKISNANVLLSTVVLLVVDAYGQEHIARALLDTGSQPNAISERMCQQLHLSRTVANVPISGVDGTVTNAKHQVCAEVRSRVTPFKLTIDFLVLRKVTSDTPPVSFATSQWKIPDDFPLADPEFHVSRRVDMIIGAAHFYTFLGQGRVRLVSSLPTLVETVFGWIVTGQVDSHEQSPHQAAVTCHVATVTSVDEQLERFWRVEEVHASNYSVDEQQCEDYYRETVSRDATGRYVVRMPKHPEFEHMIGASKVNALRRFKWLEKMLERKSDLKPQYHEFMTEYIELGHMYAVPEDGLDESKAFYLPHHPVIKESSSTTKLRVVFDGSAKTSTGHSLNDSLLTGPVVQDELISIILRFRKFPIALVADIEKMYRQVSMNREDRPYQRILWRFNSTQPIRTYELSTVTYGLAPSSFLATRTLQQLADDEGTLFPDAAVALKKYTYVDDFIGGEYSTTQAIQLRTDLTELLQKGGFRPRKWCSNSLPVLAGLPQELLATQSSMKFDPEETIKTLGISWEPEPDLFRFDVSVVTTDQPPTKRNILSAIAQLYDPLGLIAPVIVQAKILMQHLWLLALEWDDVVTPDLRQKWALFCEQLPSLSNFRIDRYAFASDFRQAELHCFVDASESAYGACIYVRSVAADGSVKVSLLASKSKVAPLKRLSIPRLELCAALLGARLCEKVLAALDMDFDACYFWSDSTVVLQWLKMLPHTLKTFVANRTSEIQTITRSSVWLHVAGAENPADLVSRGLSAIELVNSEKWKYGPVWLREDKSRWPVQRPQKKDIPADELEQKQNLMLAVNMMTPNPIFERFSSYRRLLNVVGYVFRFAHNTRSPSSSIPELVLTVAELEAAKMILVRLLQAESFPEELKLLRRGMAVPKKSPLRLLSPFVDPEGFIRVGGRLQMSEEPYNVQHQIIIPGFHPFTKLLLRYHHEKLTHGGISMTLAVVRDEFWPLQGKRAVRSVIRKCFRCNRANPRPIQQPIGQLPLARVTANEAFACTGVDYCGPFYLKPTHRRAAARKAYVCIFVCLSTKAVHLELVSDMSTAAFLMALTRFVWRRNKPSHLYSDNGTNFIGAKNLLHELYIMLQPGPDSDRINKQLAEEGIQWHLIPPRAPNFGGLWEAAVKVAKKHLVRQLGASLLSYEELTTVLTAIEGCMNSRPLSPLSEDPSDLSALTPAHFLIKNMIRPLSEPDVRKVPLSRLKQLQQLQAYSQKFWYRWRNEYLKELQTQHSRNPKRYNLDVGDVVIVKDDSLPPARWPLARVSEIHPGPDGVTRVATLRTAGALIKRAVSKICPLPCSKEE